MIAEGSASPARTTLAPGVEISRIVTGLWQIADMERDGRQVDPEAAAAAMADYVEAGFDTFDMADHYGSAELIAGRCARWFAHAKSRPRLFTKWCPEPGDMTRAVVRAGVQERLDRLSVSTIDLLQFHWWTFEHPGYLDAMKELAALRHEGKIAELGVTNFNTDHLRVLVKHGIPVASNQVCFSLLDPRPAGDMTAFCREHGVKLLAYGTLAGGFLGEKWLGAPRPAAGGDWSKMKYLRFIDAIGGWDVFQRILATLAGIGRKHGVSIANVATRWVLDQPAVAAVIVGARLGEREHRADNLRVFGFSLDDTDRDAIAHTSAGAQRIPGDCGDEYRRPPYLTASGDLSHHLDKIPSVYRSVPMEARPDRRRVDTGSVWEPVGGYSRAIRVGDRILVCGTTATHGNGEVVCPGDVASQTVYILDKIAASIAALGGSLEDVIRTRIYLRDAVQWEAASRVHGRYFSRVRPANTLLEISRLVGDYEVEIEAEAVVGPQSGNARSLVRAL